MDQRFFEESQEQSVIKARIVTKYFWAWAKVIIPTAKKHEKRIAYIDLFAGPGRYKDGTISTPLMILERAISDPEVREMLVTLLMTKTSKMFALWKMPLRSYRESTNFGIRHRCEIKKWGLRLLSCSGR